MSDNGKLQSILGLDFECEDDREASNCPPMQGDLNAIKFHDESSSWYCVECGATLSFDNVVNENEMFDEEEPGQFGANNEVVNIPPSDKGIGADDPKAQATNRRIRAYQEILEIAAKYDYKFVQKMAEAGFDYEMVRKLEKLEAAKVEGFEGGQINPKLLAIMVFEYGEEPNGLINDPRLKRGGIKRKDFDNLLEQLGRHNKTYIDPTFESAMKNLGKALDISSDKIDVIIEDWEQRNLYNSEISPIAKAAAWLFLTQKQHGLKRITKKDLIAIPPVTRNAMNNAIKSYQDQISKLNG